MSVDLCSQCGPNATTTNSTPVNPAQACSQGARLTAPDVGKDWLKFRPFSYTQHRHKWLKPHSTANLSPHPATASNTSNDIVTAVGNFSHMENWPWVVNNWVFKLLYIKMFQIIGQLKIMPCQRSITKSNKLAQLQSDRCSFLSRFLNNTKK